MGLLDSVGGFLNKATGGAFRFTPIGMAMEGLDFLGDLKSKGIGGAFKELAGDYFDSTANIATGGAYGLVTGKFLPPALGLAGGLFGMMGGMNGGITGTAGMNTGIVGNGYYPQTTMPGLNVNIGIGPGGIGIGGSLGTSCFPQVNGGGYPPSVFDRGNFYPQINGLPSGGGYGNIDQTQQNLWGELRNNQLTQREQDMLKDADPKDRAAYMLQKAQQDYQRMVQLMTQLLTMQHETTKAIIQNIRS